MLYAQTGFQKKAGIRNPGLTPGTGGALASGQQEEKEGAILGPTTMVHQQGSHKVSAKCSESQGQLVKAAEWPGGQL